MVSFEEKVDFVSVCLLSDELCVFSERENYLNFMSNNPSLDEVQGYWASKFDFCIETFTRYAELFSVFCNLISYELKQELSLLIKNNWIDGEFADDLFENYEMSIFLHELKSGSESGLYNFFSRFFMALCLYFLDMDNYKKETGKSYNLDYMLYIMNIYKKANENNINTWKIPYSVAAVNFAEIIVYYEDKYRDYVCLKSTNEQKPSFADFVLSYKK